MVEYPLNQSSWGRTRQETIHTLHSGKFWVATIILEAILMVIAYIVTPDGSSGLTYTIIQAATFALGMLAMVGLAFVFSLIVVPYRQRNEARMALISTPGATPNSPKLAHPELYITYLKHEFGVAGDGKYTGLSVDNGTPILSIEAEFHPTGPMRIEAVKLYLVGKPIPSLNWEVQQYSDHIWGSPSNAFNVSGISPGEHTPELSVWANDEDWHSHPFPIVFPEVNS